MAKQTAYGRYLIASVSKGAVWQARAFRKPKSGKRIIASDVAERDSERAAIDAIRADLDVARAAKIAARGESGIPTPEEYLAALKTISITDGQRAMLTAHFKAPGRTMTATELANAAGYKSWSSANSQYGLLARNVAEELEWEPPLHHGVPVWTFALACEAEQAAGKEELDGQHWKWTLRGELAEALAAW
ncbi:hypothetical protein ASE00_07400 [Sphingomonas sp. Root710]|uniref:hypothetical protein n=1 Tax=Sphingomonas sp. Root710 TaxID=1736594 RepID=UPI0006FF1750|nr:hypothetical protein [Sphingomonas sp. Root710]KRB86517.1 hypothetical protein ASE00_07400 [Sphingomonas sp. Root710]